MQHLATVIFRIHHIRAGNPDSGRAMAKILEKAWGPHERPIFQGACVSILQRRLWHHCQQLGDLLRVAGGEGSDAAAEAVNGRARAMQLDVVGAEESGMEDGCVGIVPGFDTKDGWFWLAVA